MKIDAFSRLFYSTNPSTTDTQSRVRGQQDNSGAKSSEAVTYAARSERAEGADGERQRRVAELKREVADGRYERSSTDVARKLAEELFA